MVIEEDELIRNEDGEIVGYEGEALNFLIGIFLGVLLGAFLGAGITAETEIGDPYLQNSDKFCTEHGYENGYYISGLLGPSETVAGIHCFSSKGSHLEDTWETTAAADFYLKSDYTIVNKTVEGGTE